MKHRSRLHLDRPRTEEVNLYRTPPVPPLPHRNDLALEYAQTARVDATSGAIDEPGIIAAGGELPQGEEIDSRIRLLQHEQEQERILAKGHNTREVTVALSRGSSGHCSPVLQQQVDTLGAQLAEAQSERAEAAAVLHGDRDDGSGRNRTGAVPQGRHPFWEWLRRQWILALFGAFDAVAQFYTFQYLMAAPDSPSVFDEAGVLTLAVVGAGCLFGLPVIVGSLLGGPHRNVDRSALRGWRLATVVGLLLGAWMTVVLLASYVRGSMIAESLLPPTTTAGGAVTATASYLVVAVLTGVYVLAGMIIMIHQARLNPHMMTVVVANRTIRRCRRQICVLQQELADNAGLVRIQQEGLANTDQAYEHHIGHALPALSHWLHQVYRTTVARTSGDPGVAGAMMMAGEAAAPAGRGLNPAEPARPVPGVTINSPHPSRPPDPADHGRGDR